VYFVKIGILEYMGYGSGVLRYKCVEEMKVTQYNLAELSITTDPRLQLVTAILYYFLPAAY